MCIRNHSCSSQREHPLPSHEGEKLLPEASVVQGTRNNPFGNQQTWITLTQVSQSEADVVSDSPVFPFNLTVLGKRQTAGKMLILCQH